MFTSLTLTYSRVVELQHFPYSESFKSFLRSHGSNIEELLFRANGPLNSSHVSFIGEQCPGLRRLHLKELGCEEERSYGVMEQVKKRLFQRLVSVHLSGRLWSPNVILPLLLSAASEVRQVSLLNMSHAACMDGAVLKLLQVRNLRPKNQYNWLHYNIN